MIISASRRTDIPAYYSDWLLNRIRSGYVLVRNPMNHAQISKIPLSPDLVDCIVFWTKDPLNMLNKLPTLDALGYRYYFQFTLTPYDTALERNLRAKTDIVNAFTQLSKLIGKDRVLWRYDPIVLNDILTIDYHKEQFPRLCERLQDSTERVTFSFVDLYPKLKFKPFRQLLPEETAELSDFIGRTAREYGLRAMACGEQVDLSQYGIEKASCIDPLVVEKVCGYPLTLKQDKNQRPACGCCESIDIGVYNTCLHNCVYCYANYSPSSVRKNIRLHDPQGELLSGKVRVDEKIRTRKTGSNRNPQISLFTNEQTTQG